jgi:hypothetical protein
MISLLHMKGVEGEYMVIMGAWEGTSGCLVVLGGGVLSCVKALRLNRRENVLKISIIDYCEPSLSSFMSVPTLRVLTCTVEACPHPQW